MNKISQLGKQLQFDVLVIGSGIAGLCYALELVNLNPKVRIALLSKTELPESNSYYAKGGVAAAFQQQEAIAAHVNDTVIAGHGLCCTAAVEKILAAGPSAIEFLQQQGVKFDTDLIKQPDLAQEGGHSQRRIYHNQDQTGIAIINILLAAIQRTPQINCLIKHSAINLITQTAYHQPGSLAEVIGAYVLEETTQLVHTIVAKIVVLATGGAGKVYRYTSNSDVATGDGVAMAYRAGARVGNMEFYQFHPTLLYNSQQKNFLITEALRGEGAYLRLPKSDERFMLRYAAEKAELSTRDIVARAMFSEMERHGCNHINLDVRHQPVNFLQKRFPGVYNSLSVLGFDLAKDLIPVLPAAHYLCGGVLTDADGKTDLPGLYAIGETAFTGLHGANRLASNSLLEAVVMARNAAQHGVSKINQPLKLYKAVTAWDSQSVTDLRRASQINTHWRGLRGEMTAYAGIIRTAAGLQDLLKLIRSRAGMIESYYWQHTITRDLIELRNIVLVAELIVNSALNREESRGGHYRADFPETLVTNEETVLQFNPYQRKMISKVEVVRI